jgi:hypothetical protein
LRLDAHEETVSPVPSARPAFGGLGTRHQVLDGQQVEELHNLKEKTWDEIWWRMQKCSFYLFRRIVENDASNAVGGTPSGTGSRNDISSSDFAVHLALEKVLEFLGHN